VIRGNDPFASLEIADAHLRLRIEQELREDVTRLRRVLIDSLGDPRALAGAVQRKAKQARFPLRALLALKKIPCADTLEAILAKSEETWRVSVAPIRNAAETPARAYDALVALLERAIEDVDRMEVS
jgi:hypothetical protein